MENKTILPMRVSPRYIAYFIVAIIVSLILTRYIDGCGNGNTIAEVDDLKEQLKKQKEETEIWKNKDSQNITRVKVIQTDLQNLFLQNQKLRESIKNAGVKDEKKITSVAVMKTATKGVATVRLDTVEKAHPKFDFVSQYMKISGVINPFNATVLLKYKREDSITIVRHTDRSWIFGKEKYYYTAFSADTSTTITGISVVEQGKKARRLNVSFGVGYVFVNNSFKPAAGIYAGYRIF